MPTWYEQFLGVIYSFFPVANVWCLLVKVSDTFVQLSAFSCDSCVVPFNFYYSFAVDYLVFTGDWKVVAIISK